MATQNETLVERILSTVGRMDQERKKVLAGVVETHAVEAYARAHGLPNYLISWNTCIAIDLGLFPRERGEEREVIVQHMRAIRKLISTSLRLSYEDTSDRFPNAKQRSYRGGANGNNIMINYHIALLPGDSCQIEEGEEVRPYKRLVCKS